MGGNFWLLDLTLTLLSKPVLLAIANFLRQLSPTVDVFFFYIVLLLVSCQDEFMTIFWLELLSKWFSSSDEWWSYRHLSPILLCRLEVGLLDYDCMLSVNYYLYALYRRFGKPSLCDPLGEKTLFLFSWGVYRSSLVARKNSMLAFIFRLKRL